MDEQEATMRKRPVRTAKIELPEPYEGWTATVWTNMPMAIYDALDTGTMRERLEALAKVILDWNFVDDAGDPIPITPEAIYETLSMDEIVITLRAVDGAVSDFLATMISRA
jgi:hypothetical protein